MGQSRVGNSAKEMNESNRVTDYRISDWQVRPNGLVYWLDCWRLVKWTGFAPIPTWDQQNDNCQEKNQMVPNEVKNKSYGS